MLVEYYLPLKYYKTIIFLWTKPSVASYQIGRRAHHTNRYPHPQRLCKVAAPEAADELTQHAFISSTPAWGRCAYIFKV